MKTFETEKNDIPEGATHYRNEDKNSLFTWLKVGDSVEIWCDIFGCWKLLGAYVNTVMSQITPIPQTKDVEWVNGDKCIYNDEEFTFVSYMCKPEEDYVVIWRSFDGIEVIYKTQISKPETKEAKERREREEKKAIDVNAMCLSVTSLKLSQAVALYEAGYRKESE